jgi:predicted nucleic acid-binding protein
MIELTIFRMSSALMDAIGTIGPMVTDAWLAALAIEWNCEFVTMDRDFSRFSKLRWKSPND